MMNYNGFQQHYAAADSSLGTSVFAGIWSEHLVNEAFWSDLLANQGEHLALLIGLVAWLETLAFVGLAVPGVAILFALCALAGSQGQPLPELLLCGFAGRPDR